MIKVTNPLDGSLIAEVAVTTEAEAMKAMETAYDTYRDRQNWLPPYKRIAILEKAAELMEARRDELARSSSSECGKPLTDSYIEVDRAIIGVRLGADELKNMHGSEVPMNITESSANRMAMTFREPRGVVLAIGPFNHPVNMTVHQIIPAIAAGCPVILKAAGKTPLTPTLLVDIIKEAGMPEGWVQSIQCDNETTAKLVSDRRLGFLSFIGSSRVGWYLRSILAPGAGCALEHGGSAPVIIDEGADIDSLALPLAKGGFTHAGQVCISVQRVYAPENMARNLAEAIAREADKLTVGDQLDPATEVGPLILESEAERVHAWVTEAAEGGAEVLCGGERMGLSCYKPTVLYNPPADAKVSTLEVFGPVVCVYPVKDVDDAIERANSLDFSFQSAIFTKNIDTAMRAVRRLDDVAVMVNELPAFRVDWMPFGGKEDSGIGVSGIGHSMREMTIEKLMVIKSPEL